MSATYGMRATSVARQRGTPPITGDRTTLLGDLRRMWELLTLSRRHVIVAIARGVPMLGSGLGSAALAEWSMVRAALRPRMLAVCATTGGSGMVRR